MNNQKLNEFEKYMQEKKVAIIGMGISNIPLLDYFYNLNAKVTIFDTKELNQLSDQLINKITKYNFNFIGGENSLNNLVGFDIIFRSPSCLPNIPQIKKAVENGAILTSEIEMLIKLTQAKVIGITGTEGKTTTSSLIYEIIKKSGRKCFLGRKYGKTYIHAIKRHYIE